MRIWSACRHRRRCLQGVVLLIALPVLLAGCSGGTAAPYPKLNILRQLLNAPKTSLVGVTPGEVVSFGGMFFCLTMPGRVQLLSATVTHATGGMRIVDFGARPNPSWKGTGNQLGAFVGGLSAAGFRATRTVSIPCGSMRSGRGYEFAVAVARSEGQHGIIRGIRIRYRSAGGVHQVVYPLEIAVCGPLHDPVCLDI